MHSKKTIFIAIWEIGYRDKIEQGCFHQRKLTIDEGKDNWLDWLEQWQWDDMKHLDSQTVLEIDPVTIHWLFSYGGVRDKKQSGIVSKCLTGTISQDSKITSSVLCVCTYHFFYINDLYRVSKNASTTLFHIPPYQSCRNFWHLDSFLHGVTPLFWNLKSFRSAFFGS